MLLDNNVRVLTCRFQSGAGASAMDHRPSDRPEETGGPDTRMNRHLTIIRQHVILPSLRRTLKLTKGEFAI